MEGEADDQHLLTRFRSRRDPAAFDRLVDRHQAGLLRLATAVLSDEHLARDAVQDAFLRLANWAAEILDERRGWDHQPVNGSLGPWLRRVVRNRCIDLLRKRREEPLGPVEPAAAAAEDPAARGGGADTATCLWRAVDDLTPLQRAAVLLRYRDGLSYQAIAEELERSVSHVGVLLHEALARLRASKALAAEVLS